MTTILLMRDPILMGISSWSRLILSSVHMVRKKLQEKALAFKKLCFKILRFVVGTEYCESVLADSRTIFGTFSGSLVI